MLLSTINLLFFIQEYTVSFIKTRKLASEFALILLGITPYQNFDNDFVNICIQPYFRWEKVDILKLRVEYDSEAIYTCFTLRGK